MRYRQIPHTADVGIVAYGNNLEDAFANAAYGMFALMTRIRTVRQIESHHIELEEGNMEDLLFAWLNRLLYTFDVEHLLFRHFDVKIQDTSLEAACYGEHFDPGRHEIIAGIKSATYHNLEVDRQKNRLRVIFDI